MTGGGRLPPALAASLRAEGDVCYRHCEESVRRTEIPSGLPGLWQVLACPSGVVSVLSYTELGRRDPTPQVKRLLRRWTLPLSVVRRQDLRLATRQGPELGIRAERYLSSRGAGRKVWVVYWRVYPFKGADGKERRLGVCLGRHRSPVFFLGSPGSPHWICPVCLKGPGSLRTRRRPGRDPSSRG